MRRTALWKAALFTTLFATTTTSVSAMYMPGQEESTAPVNVTADKPLDYSENGLTYRLVINGKGFAPAQTSIYSSQNQLMIPVRTAAEALGFALTWHPENQTLELVKGNQWFSIKIGADQYNIAKMLVKLGATPELTNGKTYVPLAFFSDVVKANVQVDETGTVSISDKVEGIAKRGVITSIGESQIGMNGFAYGTKLNITENTVITASDGKKLAFNDLRPGMEIDVRHAEIATASLPPITNALQITVKNPEATDLLGTAGEITEVKELDGIKRITVKGEGLSDQAQDVIILTISSDTVITGTKDNQTISAQELKPGQKVYAFYGPILLKSMPPIGGAARIMIEK